VKAVVFDLDDTLIAESDWVRSGYEAVAEHLRTNYPGPTREDLVGLMAAAYRHDSRHVFDQVANQLEPVPWARIPLVTECVQIYRHHTPPLTPLPGVLDLLTWARARWTLVIATGGYSPSQRVKVRASGLGTRVDRLLFEDDLPAGWAKPNVAWFLKAASLAGVPPTACVHVGDNPARDCRAAKRAGMRTVRIRWPSGIHATQPSEAADLEVESASALRAALLQLQKSCS
jgi:putative hydrolase of the HAD superfamily